MLRFYSTEENADDVSVLVLRAAGLQPNGTADFMVSMLDEDHQIACYRSIDHNEVPAYGVNLLDDHHAPCWRAYHMNQLADATASQRRAVRPSRTELQLPPRLPLPKRPKDWVVY